MTESNETEVNPEETWTQMARRIGNERGFEVDDFEADFILWNHTAFPFGHPERIVEQVDTVFAKATLIDPGSQP